MDSSAGESFVLVDSEINESLGGTQAAQLLCDDAATQQQEEALQVVGEPAGAQTTESDDEDEFVSGDEDLTADEGEDNEESEKDDDVVVAAEVVVAPAEPAEPVPAEPAPVEPAPVEPAPVEPAPVEPAPVEPAPVVPAPVEPAPVEPAPAPAAPVEPARVDPAPAVPAEPAPVEPAPVEPTPTEPAPAPAPVLTQTLGESALNILLEALESNSKMCFAQALERLLPSLSSGEYELVKLAAKNKGSKDWEEIVERLPLNVTPATVANIRILSDLQKTYTEAEIQEEKIAATTIQQLEDEFFAEQERMYQELEAKKKMMKKLRAEAEERRRVKINDLEEKKQVAALLAESNERSLSRYLASFGENPGARTVDEVKVLFKLFDMPISEEVANKQQLDGQTLMSMVESDVGPEMGIDTRGKRFRLWSLVQAIQRGQDLTTLPVPANSDAPRPRDVQLWSAKHVADWARENGNEEAAKALFENDICGAELLTLKAQDFRQAPLRMSTLPIAFSIGNLVTALAASHQPAPQVNE